MPDPNQKQLTLDLSQLRMPNMEFVVYVIALLVGVIVIAASDALTIGSWWTFFIAATVAYILSRGIAKAHNVKE